MTLQNSWITSKVKPYNFCNSIKYDDFLRGIRFHKWMELLELNFHLRTGLYLRKYLSSIYQIMNTQNRFLAISRVKFVKG